MHGCSLLELMSSLQQLGCAGYSALLPVQVCAAHAPQNISCGKRQSERSWPLGSCEIEPEWFGRISTFHLMTALPRRLQRTLGEPKDPKDSKSVCVCCELV